jgi:hypothetical protein
MYVPELKNSQLLYSHFQIKTLFLAKDESEQVHGIRIALPLCGLALAVDFSLFFFETGAKALPQSIN